jgi:formate dehydrogenase major subunit
VDDGAVYSWFDLFDAMYKEKIKGFFAWGQNPACSGSNANKTRKALGQTGLDGQRQPVRQRNRVVLEWPGDGSGHHQDRGLHAAGLRIGGKGRQHHQQRPLDAVALPGPQALGNSRPDGDIILELGEKIKAAYKPMGAFFPNRSAT